MTIESNALIDPTMDRVLSVGEAYRLIQLGLSGGDAFGREARRRLRSRSETVVAVDRPKPDRRGGRSQEQPERRHRGEETWAGSVSNFRSGAWQMNSRPANGR
ncbi:hypothetical protein ACIA5H_31900 [Nocardia sp. NPDC051900]|uniref:hypothetical protein n=1 Tax=Nocardia sp. NPDC051900 TaxID=3364326 RepID=UPI0037AB0782